MGSSFRQSAFAALWSLSTFPHLALNQPADFILNGFGACPAVMDGYGVNSGANPLDKLCRAVIIGLHGIGSFPCCVLGLSSVKYANSPPCFDLES